MKGMTTGDRKVLIVLLVLVLGLLGYLGFSRAKSSDQPTILHSVVRDTIFIETASDTISAGTDTLPIRTSQYPGPPQRPTFPKKLTEGATIDLNSADTLLLVRVPGIGESFARRIYKYRELLGGYYVVEQLQEVYGMDRERYDQIAPYMRIETPVRPLLISRDSIPKHPYLQWQHKRAIERIYQSGKEVTWSTLMESGKFSRDDSLRLVPYLSFSKPEDDVNTRDSHLNKE